MVEKKIFVTQPLLPELEDVNREIAEIWESKWLTNMGKKHNELESKLKDVLKVPNVSLFNNGTIALLVAIKALDLPYGSEIITTPFTFAATPHCISWNGLKVVFCDIEPDTYTLDPSKIEVLITPRTCAIVPVHVYGNICDNDAIMKIAKKHGLKVIYDAAHAFGESVNGVNAANLGDASMFSFHATKVFHSVEGGAVTCQDEKLVSRLNMEKNFGIPGEDRILEVGGNAKMSEFHAAMGICNLRHIGEYIASRKTAAERYRANLSGVPGLKLCPVQEGVVSNYAYLPVVFDGSRRNRDEVLRKLAEQEIFARKYFYPLTNDCECYGYAGDRTPVAKYIAERVLTLPLYADLGSADVDRICEIICD